MEPADLSWRHFFLHALEAFTQVDGKIFRTLRYLVTKPGLLTADYIRGKRRPYLTPLAVFLICNLLFFLLQPLIDWDTFSTPLRSHLNEQAYRTWVAPLVEKKIAATSTTLEAYAARFDHYVGVEARALTLALVPLFFLLLLLIQVWRHRRTVEHFIFALHFCAALLLFQLVILGAGRLVIAALGQQDLRAHWDLVDKGTMLMGIIVNTVYLFVALRVVYGGPRWTAWLKAVVLACGVFPVFVVYRLFLFFVAFWRT